MQACWDHDCGRGEIGSTDLARPALRSPPGRASVELTGKGETWTMVWARGAVYTALAPGPEVEPFGAPSGRTASVMRLKFSMYSQGVTI